MLRCAETDSWPSFEIELQLLEQGYSVIAGADEVGRGALAGPLCVGVVIFTPVSILNPPTDLIESVNDSKKLSPRQRSAAIRIIDAHAACVITRMVSHKVVDRLNINGATHYVLQKILNSLAIRPDVVIMDGSFKFESEIPVIPVIRGDTRSTSIASASIAAKLRRDAIMEKFDLLYPGYCLKNNKGYGTPEHMECIFERGPSPIHRRSYEPVKGMSDPITLSNNENH